MALNWKDRFQSALNAFPPTQRHALNRAITKQAVAVSEANATATSSATLVAHTELVADLLPGKYLLHGLLYLSIAAAAQGIKLDLNGGTLTAASALASITGIARFSLANGTTLIVPITALNASLDGATTNAWISCELDATITIDGPGTLALQYAQSSSGATATTVSAKSSMHFLQVA